MHYISKLEVIKRNILQRTFNVRYANQIATGFTLELEEEQYLISCRHNFPFSQYEDEIIFSIRIGNDWKEIKGICYFDMKSSADVVAIKLTNDISPRLNVVIGKADTFYVGEPAYFLGFPLGKFIEDQTHINNSYPFPFVKCSTISSQVFIEDEIKKVYLDGINNKGFSGGPVFTRVGRNLDINLIGIIKGYIPEGAKLDTFMGKIEFEQNSGIIEVHCADQITKIFDIIVSQRKA